MSMKTKIAVGAIALLAALLVWQLQSPTRPPTPTDGPLTTSRTADTIGEPAAGSPTPASQPSSAIPVTPFHEPESAPASAPASTATTGSLLVKVTWQADHRPAAKIPVRIYVWQVPDPYFNALYCQTDDAGLIHVEHVTSGGVLADSPFGGSARGRVEPAKECQLALEIPAGATIDGTVVDQDDHAVSGAEIFVADYDTIDPREVLTHSDAEGHFHIASMAAELWKNIGARMDGFEPSVFPMVTATPGQLVKLKLKLGPRGGELRGVVLSPDGEPAAGVEVTATTTQRPNDGRQITLPDGGQAVQGRAQVAHTGANGAFRLASLPGGAHAIVARAPRAGCWTGEADITPGGTRTIEIRLPRGVRLAGTVKALDGTTGLRGEVTVRVAGFRDTFFTLLAPDGSYELAHLPSGELEVAAELSRKGSPLKSTTKLTAAPEADLRWDAVVGGGVAIRGKIVDERDVPLTNWWLAAESNGSSGFDMRSATTGADGQFEFPDCTAADYRIRVQQPDSGFFSAALLASVHPGGPPLLIRINDRDLATCLVTGVVVGPDGKPLQGAEVSAGRTVDQGRPIELTDATGHFKFGPAPPGTWQLTVRMKELAGAGFGPKTLGPGESWDLGEIRLEEPGYLNLHVTGPLPRTERVGVSLSNAARTTHLWLSLQDGAGRSGPLAPGAWLIRIGMAGCALAEIPFEIIAGRDTEKTVAVAPGVGVHVSFPGAVAGETLTSLPFRILDDHGGLLFTETAWRERSGPLEWTSALLPGTYRIEVPGPNGPRGAGTLTVPRDNTPVELAIKLER